MIDFEFRKRYRVRFRDWHSNSEHEAEGDLDGLVKVGWAGQEKKVVGHTFRDDAGETWHVRDLNIIEAEAVWHSSHSHVSRSGPTGSHQSSCPLYASGTQRRTRVRGPWRLFVARGLGVVRSPERDVQGRRITARYDYLSRRNIGDAVASDVSFRSWVNDTDESQVFVHREAIEPLTLYPHDPIEFLMLLDRVFVPFGDVEVSWKDKRRKRREKRVRVSLA